MNVYNDYLKNIVYLPIILLLQKKELNKNTITLIQLCKLSCEY